MSIEEPGPGGLATALSAALDERGGLWFGWSGRTADAPNRKPKIARCRGFALATIDLAPSELEGYYECLANRALWPTFHARLDLLKTDDAAYSVYRDVNRRFAKALHPLLDDDDIIWIHDYHLIPLGLELRKLGVESPIGFFLHVPFAGAETFAALPWARELAAALTAYDLIGFQTPSDTQNFAEYIDRHLAGASVVKDTLLFEGRGTQVECHPIGIDTRRFADLAASPQVSARAARIRECLRDRTGIAGVERLDYSKGITERFRAFEAFLRRFPEYENNVTLYQAAAPSRLSVPEYQAMQSELNALSGRINAQLGTFEWYPIRYLNRALSHHQIAALFRASRVGLVTPLRDGMNLVAKEYIAAQAPADPGVLVLSCFAGAAHELTDAVIVNPYDQDDMANGLHRALSMPLSERRACWQSMMRHLETADVHRWQRGFLNALISVRKETAPHQKAAA